MFSVVTALASISNCGRLCLRASPMLRCLSLPAEDLLCAWCSRFVPAAFVVDSKEPSSGYPAGSPVPAFRVCTGLVIMPLSVKFGGPFRVIIAQKTDSSSSAGDGNAGLIRYRRSPGLWEVCEVHRLLGLMQQIPGSASVIRHPFM